MSLISAQGYAGNIASQEGQQGEAAHRAAAKAGAQAPIIPAQSVAGRALLAVIAIMSFLAALTLGAVVLVRTTAAGWQSQIAREVTVQVRPVEGRNFDADVARAAEITRSQPGVTEAKPFSRQESARLLEPWLGAGLNLDELPVPRIIVVSVAAGATLDTDALRRSLAQQVPSATLDDHRGWVARMRAVTRMAVTVGLTVLGLMLAATILLVAFATRGAMAANRTIVEVLHFVGAKNRYIAAEFQRHFLLLGLKGALIGGCSALLVFVVLHAASGWQDGTGAAEFEALFGAARVGLEGYAGIAGIIVLIAAVTAITSRWTVHRTLDALE